MSFAIADTLLALAALYLAAGAAFAIAFHARGLARIDAAAAAGTRGFRIAITPGVVACWPLLARSWLRARNQRP